MRDLNDVCLNKNKQMKIIIIGISANNMAMLSSHFVKNTIFNYYITDIMNFN